MNQHADGGSFVLVATNGGPGTMELSVTSSLASCAGAGCHSNVLGEFAHPTTMGLIACAYRRTGHTNHANLSDDTK